MTFLMNYSNVLSVLIIILTANGLTQASNVLRSQQITDTNIQSSRNSDDQSNGHTIQTQPSFSSKSIHDLLVSIDERIRLLEAYDNTYKLTRIDFTLEQLTQRMVSIESKISRLELSLDSKLSKMEEKAVSNDRKGEFRSESISRRIENLSDRLDSKSIQIESKFETKNEKIYDKLESIQRNIDSNNEEISEKLIKYDERQTVFESHVKSHIINIENLVKHSLDANTKIKDIVSYDFECVDKLVLSVKEQKQNQMSAISRLSSIADQIQNSSSLTQTNVGKPKSCDNSGLNDNNRTQIVTNNLNANLRTVDETKDMINSNIYENISLTLQELKQMGVDEKLTQLDVHIDYFSRKIINTIQEIWRTSQSSQSYLREALDMANKTRSNIQIEFRRLQELIGPLTKTPDFSEIREPLEQKLYQLSSTIDDSFNALMISQNSFISSCNRIQEEEEQLYDVLDDMLIEIRNKSSLDISNTNQSINALKVMINDSFDRLVPQIQSIDKHLIDLKNQIQTISDNRYSTQNIQPSEECFLTRTQLLNVCHKNENQRNSKTNKEQIEEEKSEEKTEPIYEDLPQTE